MIKAARHTGNRMAITTRSRCIRRLNTSPILFIQPYLWRSKACPWAAVVASFGAPIAFRKLSGILNAMEMPVEESPYRVEALQHLGKA